MDDLLRAFPVALLSLLVARETYLAMQCTSRTFQMPFLSAATFSVLILPTLLVNVTNDQTIRTPDFLRFGLFSLACLYASNVTYRRTQRVQHPPSVAVPTVSGSLLFASLLPFSVVAFGSLTKIDAKEYGSVLGGSFAIFLFFARLTRPIQILAWGGFLVTNSRRCLLLALACIAATLPFIFVSGRRSDTLFLPLAILTPLWAIKGLSPKPRYILTGIAFVLLVFFLLPLARVSMRTGSYSELLTLNYSEELTRSINGENTNEVVEVALDMAAAEKTGIYSYGVEFYNKLVHQYVSSTIFGASAKENAMLSQPNLEHVRRVASRSGEHYGHHKFYLSRFGFGDAFLAFGWFGILYFVAFGYLCAKLYDACFSTLDSRPRLVYCVLTVFIPYAIYDSFSAVLVQMIPWTAMAYTCLYIVPRSLARGST